MPVHELLSLSAQIEQRLPVKLLKDLNLEQELVMQLLTSQQLQRDVPQDDGNQPTSQPTSQPANQPTSGRGAQRRGGHHRAPIQLQSEVCGSERFKRIEQVLTAERIRKKLLSRTLKIGRGSLKAITWGDCSTVDFRGKLAEREIGHEGDVAQHGLQVAARMINETPK